MFRQKYPKPLLPTPPLQGSLRYSTPMGFTTTRSPFGPAQTGCESVPWTSALLGGAEVATPFQQTQRLYWREIPFYHEREAQLQPEEGDGCLSRPIGRRVSGPAGCSEHRNVPQGVIAGVLSFGYFSFSRKRKVTRPGGRKSPLAVGTEIAIIPVAQQTNHLILNQTPIQVPPETLQITP